MRSPRALAASLLLLSAACGGDDPRFGSPDAGHPIGAGGSGGSIDPVTAGPVISDNPIANYEAETHLAVAPDGRVFAVWIALQLGPQRFVGYARSKDGGATWDKAGVVPSDPDAAAVDPSVTVDAQGAFHLVWLELPSAGGRRVKTAAYMDDFDAFTVPLEISDPAAAGPADKPWIVAVDGGTLLVVWGSDSGSTLWAATSTDGQTFQRTTYAPDGTLRNLAVPCDAGKGRVYMPYAVPGGVELTRSDDGGATWQKPVRVDEGGAAFTPPSCAASGDDVWVLYGTSTSADDELHTPLLDSVLVARSKDGAASIAQRVPLGDAAAPKALLPFLSRAPGGRLDVVAYRGHAAFDSHASVRWSHSSDGVAWSAPVTVHAPLLLTTERDGFGWLGDYLGVRSSDDALYVTFADNASGPGTLSHVRFGKVAVP